MLVPVFSERVDVTFFTIFSWMKEVLRESSSIAFRASMMPSVIKIICPTFFIFIKVILGNVQFENVKIHIVRRT